MELRGKIGRDGGRGEYLVGGVFISFKMIRGERRGGDFLGKSGDIFWECHSYRWLFSGILLQGL